jgi:hypothetical protein
MTKRPDLIEWLGILTGALTIALFVLFLYAILGSR